MRYLSKAKRFEAVQAYVLYFFFYSVLGWLYEVFLEVVVYRWGFTNRGVLLGPYCPVYGVGALVFLLCFSRLMAKREPSWIRWAKPVLVFLLHDHGHRHRAGHQLHSGGPHRSLALADVPGL